MSRRKHTKTPWRIRRFKARAEHNPRGIEEIEFLDSRESFVILKTCGHTPQGSRLEDDAIFAITAINSHEVLLRACKAAFKELSSINQNQNLIDLLDHAIYTASVSQPSLM